MKNILKKCVLLLVAVLLAAGTVGTDLPALSTASRVEAAEDADVPEYVAKLKGTYTGVSGTEHKWVSVYQTAGASEGATYRFRYSYYVAEGSYTKAVMWTGTRTEAAAQSMNSGTQGTVELEFTAEAGESWFGAKFECQPDTTCYIWNVSLKKDGDDKEILWNGNFKEGSGSWIGWFIGGTKRTNKAESDEAVAEYGHEVLPYDSSLFDSDIADWSVEPRLETAVDLTYKTALKVEPVSGSTPTMSFVMTDGNDWKKEETVTGTLGSDGRYSFSFEVLPQQMAYTIKSTLAVVTASGKQMQTKEYSVKEYCTSILKDSGSQTPLKNLIADLLRYGRQTQKMFGIEDTITSGLESAISGFGNNGALADITDYITSPVSGDQTSSTYKWKSASLVLDGRVTLRFKFTTDADISNLTVRVNGADYTVGGTNAIFHDENGGFYYVDFPVAANEHSEAVSAGFYVGGQQSGATLTYSVHTYLYRMKDRENQKDLLQAVYNYGQSAETYSQYMHAGLDNELSDAWDF